MSRQHPAVMHSAGTGLLGMAARWLLDRLDNEPKFLILQDEDLPPGATNIFGAEVLKPMGQFPCRWTLMTRG